MNKNYQKIVIFILLIFTIGFIFINLKVLENDGRDDSARQIGNRRKFGATYMTTNNRFYEIINDEIRSVVESNGDILVTRDAALDKDKQMQQIYEFIKLKVKAIFINPVDWKQVKPALVAAKNAGIPVIVVDTPVYDNKLVACTVISDNYDAGVQCAKYLMKMKTKANIMLIEHSEAKSGIDRIKGFVDTIGNNKQYKIVAKVDSEGQLDKAMPLVNNLIKKHPEIDAIMALNDPSALGALAALKENGLLGKVMVFGVDGSPEAKTMIRYGFMTATSAQFPNKIGNIAARKAYDILKGEKFKKDVIVPITLISKENVLQYEISGWK
ncbi:sugar ABC transporter substrate-binding protein [Clostridium hydrogenum]|uniref:sugar ABC transporter substrate-binding protein n=1 Tax=Clostridium hydrogenum TaxID=2855764 RepID=UPI001F23CB15|nr:sugar ABC transporter substrate-binding protein [Clostridium hydrogenum]